MKKQITLLAMAVCGLVMANPENEIYKKKSTWRETATEMLGKYSQFRGKIYSEMITGNKTTITYSIAGPFQAKEKQKLNIKDKGDSASVLGKDYPWRKLPDFKPYAGNDLAKMSGLKKGDCALFRIHIDRPPQKGISTIETAHGMQYGKFSLNPKNITLVPFEKDTPFVHPGFAGGKAVGNVLGRDKGMLYSVVKVSDDGTCIVSATPYPKGIVTMEGVASLLVPGILTRYVLGKLGYLV